MVKLKKTKPVEWLGVAMGSTTADWVVVGFEHIAVRKLGISWFAVDTSEYAILNGRKINKKIAKADTKAALLDVLAAKLQAAA